MMAAVVRRPSFELPGPAITKLTFKLYKNSSKQSTGQYQKKEWSRGCMIGGRRHQNTQYKPKVHAKKAISGGAVKLI